MSYSNVETSVVVLLGRAVCLVVVQKTNTHWRPRLQVLLHELAMRWQLTYGSGGASSMVVSQFEVHNCSKRSVPSGASKVI